MQDGDTETPDPWWMRVNLHLRNMEKLTAAIGEGRTDISHARLLDEEADAMDELVDEGTDDPYLVTEGEVDYELYLSVESSLKNSSDLVDELIADAKADKVEIIVILVLLSLFFVMVLTGLIIALIRPWAKRSGLRPKRSQKAEDHAVAKDEGRTFPDAIFVQHSHVNMDPYRHHDTKI
ncbi:uncharacterized protein LOC123498399 [Portunus trituberculatus]|uniref:uncharacterized protein LOC123498399 n=1 Tax=Portunus trituberculatus TaxID=210409 RepID=UPI001E1CE10C|nr:uncharacterized protein LOC123498399 [Portunus trituberculatus]